MLTCEGTYLIKALTFSKMQQFAE